MLKQIIDVLLGRTLPPLAVRVASMAVSSGDTIVITCERMLTAQQRESIVKRLATLAPAGVRTMVLDGGLDIKTLKADHQGYQPSASQAIGKPAPPPIKP